MTTKANFNSNEMVPNGTSTSRTHVSDVKNSSISKSDAGSNSAPIAASEKTYRCVTGRGAHYVVRAKTPGEAVLKMAVIQEREEMDTLRKDDKDAYDLREEARRGNLYSKVELRECYTLMDARPYGAQRPHWLYTLDLKVEEVAQAI